MPLSKARRQLDLVVEIYDFIQDAPFILLIPGRTFFLPFSLFRFYSFFLSMCVCLMLFQETFFGLFNLLISLASTLCIWFLLVFQLPGPWLDIMFWLDRRTSLPVERKTVELCHPTAVDYLSSGCFEWIITVVCCLNQGQKPNKGYIASHAFPAFMSLQESVTSEWDLYHDYTTSQLGLHELLREWRAEMDIFSREPGRYRCGSHNSTMMLSCKKLGLLCFWLLVLLLNTIYDNDDGTGVT